MKLKKATIRLRTSEEPPAFSNAFSDAFASGAPTAPNQSTVDGTVQTIPLPPSAAQTMAAGLTADGSGTAQGSIAVEIQLLTPPASATAQFDRTPVIVTSDANGNYTVPLIRAGAIYRLRRAGVVSWTKIVTPDEATMVLPPI